MRSFNDLLFFTKTKVLFDFRFYCGKIRYQSFTPRDFLRSFKFLPLSAQIEVNNSTSSSVETRNISVSTDLLLKENNLTSFSV